VEASGAASPGSACSLALFWFGQANSNSLMALITKTLGGLPAPQCRGRWQIPYFSSPAGNGR